MKQVQTLSLNLGFKDRYSRFRMIIAKTNPLPSSASLDFPLSGMQVAEPGVLVMKVIQGDSVEADLNRFLCDLTLDLAKVTVRRKVASIFFSVDEELKLKASLGVDSIKAEVSLIIHQSPLVKLPEEIPLETKERESLFLEFAALRQHIIVFSDLYEKKLTYSIIKPSEAAFLGDVLYNLIKAARSSARSATASSREQIEHLKIVLKEMLQFALKCFEPSSCDGLCALGQCCPLLPSVNKSLDKMISVAAQHLHQYNREDFDAPRTAPTVTKEDIERAGGLVAQDTWNGVWDPEQRDSLYMAFRDERPLELDSAVSHSTMGYQIKKAQEGLAARFTSTPVLSDNLRISSHDRERGRVSTLSTKELEPTPGDMIRNQKLVFDKAEEMAQTFRQTIAQAEAVAE